MPSPFPGIDPFIEGQRWESFHNYYVVELSAALVPQVRPRYIVQVEERRYLERQADRSPLLVRPDLTVAAHPGAPPSSGRVATATAQPPVVLTLPMPREEREVFLTIRARDTMEVVTILELLSPSNKRPGSDGRREYLSKREQVLRSPVHLVELDLLRGGERLPTVEPLPPADYYAFVSRSNRRPRVEVYPWTLRQPLPTIPVPLAAGDPDVRLDLQAAFTSVYDRAGYDYALDYRQPVEPALGEEEVAWVRSLLESPPKP